MNIWKIILATVVIFGAGVITGGLLVNNAVQSHPQELQAAQTVQHPLVNSATNPPAAQTNNRDTGQPLPSDLPQPRPAEILNKQFVQQLDKTLHLTSDQRAAIAKIVAEGQERNHDIWTNVAPQYHKVLQDVRQQIREQLAPEQRKKFEELLKRFRPPGHHSPPPAGSQPPTNEPGPLAPTNSAPVV